MIYCKQKIEIKLYFLQMTFFAFFNMTINWVHSQNSEAWTSGGTRLECIAIEGATYRVHAMNVGWLGEISQCNINDYYNGFAGKKDTPIDGLAVCGATYQVHLKGGNWLPKVNQYNINDWDNGMAGIQGREIDAVRIEGKSFYVGFWGDSDPDWVDPTGIRGIPYQSQMDGFRRDGCLVLCACVLADLHSVGSMQSARQWAIDTGRIRPNDNYVNMSGTQLGRDFASHFGTRFHDEWYIHDGRNHFCVHDHNGNEIFNSAGHWFGH